MKYSTSTYLKNITKYKLYLYRNNNKFITIKKVINIIEPVGTNQLLSERWKNLYRYSCLPTDIIFEEEALLECFFGERKINTFHGIMP